MAPMRVGDRQRGASATGGFGVGGLSFSLAGHLTATATTCRVFTARQFPVIPSARSLCWFDLRPARSRAVVGAAVSGVCLSADAERPVISRHNRKAKDRSYKSTDSARIDNRTPTHSDPVLAAGSTSIEVCCVVGWSNSVGEIRSPVSDLAHKPFNPARGGIGGFVRAFGASIACCAVALLAPAALTKENLIVLVVGLLSGI